MRPVALSDESLNSEEAEEHRFFARDGEGFGSRNTSIQHKPDSFDDEDFPEEDIDDLLAIFNIGDE